MRFLQRNRFVLLFLVFAVVCSVLVVRQIIANQAKHLEIREAFILLHVKGHLPQAQRLYERLVRDLETEPVTGLFDDFQRTSVLVDPGKQQPDNLLWKYYWSVSNELEKRSPGPVERALKLADEVR